MHLDAADLRTGKVLLVVDVVDVVVLDHGEDTAQMPHNTGLTAVVDMAAPDNVVADPLLGPALPLCLTDALPLGLGAVLVFCFQPLVVIFRLVILAQGDAAALGLGDVAVFNDPALGPVGADHALLEGCGRRPLGGGLCDGKAGQGDVVDSFRQGEKAAGTDGYFHILGVGVIPVEIGIEHGFVRLRILPGEPGVHRKIRVPGGL